MKTLRLENSSLMERLLQLDATLRCSDSSQMLRQECTSIASAINSLARTQHELQRNIEEAQCGAHSLDTFQQGLAETKKYCEEKMKRYEDDLGSLLASWQQQQMQLDVCSHTITTQQQELEATQAQVTEAQGAAQRAESTRLMEKERWEQEEKGMRQRLEEMRQKVANFVQRGENAQDLEVRNDMLVREVEQVHEGAGMLRERVQRQTAMISELSEGIKQSKEVRTRAYHVLRFSHKEQRNCDWQRRVNRALKDSCLRYCIKMSY